MDILKRFTLAAAAAAMVATVPSAIAQGSIQIGAPPAFPYGYYDYAPYSCAPYGYYGPQWFSGGVFIGAGPWFHGPGGFRGYVNNRFDPHYGYHGGAPNRGEQAFAHGEDRSYSHFQGNEMRDGRGHAFHGR